MHAVKGLSIARHFRSLEDPRIERTKKHLLLDIITLTICAVIAGAEGWEDVEDYGKEKYEWLKTFLALPAGIPSHDTISRVFRRLKPEQFEQCLVGWLMALSDALGVEHIAIDGKTLRRSFDRASAANALHLVSAWSVKNSLTLGQVAVDEKSNEITAIPALLRLLELKGAIVTIDAMGCQKEIAAQIVNEGGDYVLAVKENHPKLHEALVQHFERLHDTDFQDGTCHRHNTVERAHGREEERFYYTTSVPASLAEHQPGWTGLASVGQVITVTQREGRETSDVRYYISSLDPRVKRFAEVTRGHWGIENSLHWVLDVTFNEDQSRIRKDHGQRNFACLRRFTTSLIKQDTSRGSIRRKRKRAAWNNQVLLNILMVKR
jgi:predicted transposase YbfD/YdcC